MIDTPDPVDPKEKFKAALEKKKSQNAQNIIQSASKGTSKLHAATGNKHKMFRRKSG